MSDLSNIGWLVALVQERDALRAQAEKLESQLAWRESQVGFTENCASHGRAYSPTCGACSISQRILKHCPNSEPAS